MQAWFWCHSCIANPDEYSPFLVNRQSFGIDEFFFEIFEDVVVQAELPLQGSIRDPAFALEQRDHVREDFIKLHPRSSHNGVLCPASRPLCLVVAGKVACARSCQPPDNLCDLLL